MNNIETVKVQGQLVYPPCFGLVVDPQRPGSLEVHPRMNEWVGQAGQRYHTPQDVQMCTSVQHNEIWSAMSNS